MAGCSVASSECPTGAADCEAQIRMVDVIYTSYGTTTREGSRHLRADQAECHDTGCNAVGSVFPDVPTQVRTWTFKGYSPDEVLGVRFGNDGFGVFIADTLEPATRRRIYADLSGAKS
ncbi:DUF6281 family protein [Rhodoblastus acidophilus]|uniref:DUF6281 family protein n=2 Tax=Candidatus Rhodoblastus alkanivorans TaxID=2954117 RepID=A0ABS9ZBZ7_9HYPH|nr:DUF6281 family protein [Candidatus Rhodoblastus alkanivorans]MDI4643291.1 DUF6281 family protein [Rhodoblastus acidophilus]